MSDDHLQEPEWYYRSPLQQQQNNCLVLTVCAILGCVLQCFSTLKYFARSEGKGNALFLFSQHKFELIKTLSQVSMHIQCTCMNQQLPGDSVRTVLQMCCTCTSWRFVCPLPSLVTQSCFIALKLKSILTFEITTGVVAINGQGVSTVHTPITRGINNGQTLNSCNGNII